MYGGILFYLFKGDLMKSFNVILKYLASNTSKPTGGSTHTETCKSILEVMVRNTRSESQYKVKYRFKENVFYDNFPGTIYSRIDIHRR